MTKMKQKYEIAITDKINERKSSIANDITTIPKYKFLYFYLFSHFPG